MKYSRTSGIEDALGIFSEDSNAQKEQFIQQLSLMMAELDFIPIEEQSSEK